MAAKPSGRRPDLLPSSGMPLLLIDSRLELLPQVVMQSLPVFSPPVVEILFQVPGIGVLALQIRLLIP
jgi:hypothetical protein